ncbi:MAG: dihydrodipicolinate synthase family protein [Rhodospirillaceae bacterium]|jgi:2-keto-3-deoxy-L-arabinonate dehydratase|nr:dihydrodipicolinate synthase family protein [Rhodospirillaceae bacterium]MBT3628037.1 dihydrodipicolinate synthase family protein [Rhodospirillaceae bacterium]MBT3926115.1 dihydrodipicolinate synthase family protein [Rhodospirillaceae bacterium]MBT4427137.1 dihydrodipicolinate synthase family protein [Rhodospirillaceae bacterium]MBT5675818.1 dihydrodipicolinate synthase family protein [Rhodospirillaceae bacterium]
MNKKTHSGFFGVYPMLLAFFQADGSLDLNATALQVDALVRHGAHGCAVMGLGTEVNKLSYQERRAVIDTVAERLDGRLPFCVTVGENNVAGQIEFAHAAEAAGADWLILQPPTVGDLPEQELLRFFGQIADATSLPLGVQNAPQYLGIGLSNAGLRELHAQHENFKIVKIEDDPLALPPLLEATDGALDVFVGRAGLEALEVFRAGACGLIPGFETFDRLALLFDHLGEGRDAEADALYQSIEPALVFMLKSINHFVTYSREVSARRLALPEIHHRLGVDVTPLGQRLIEKIALQFGPL